MESWNHIIHTALLGTEKKVLKKEELLNDLAVVFETIAINNLEKEELFLQAAALTYNYRQCGVVPLHKTDIIITKASEEEKMYAGIMAHSVLADILESGSISLLELWLENCSAKNRIVQPEIIPVLLDTASRNKALRTLIYACCGKRGAWVSQFNASWKYSDTSDMEELWQSGTLEQRKEVLRQLRSKDPEKSRQMLQQTWKQENASSKTELLHQFFEQAGEADLPWLEELLQEKSGKVKDVVIELLRQIPSSSIVQLYWRLLQPSIELRKEKTMMGFSSKNILEIFPVKQVDEYIFKTGIEKMSSEKNVSDDAFLLYQLIMAIPPSFWEQHLGLSKEEIVKSINHMKQGKNFLPAFGQAAIHFRDVASLKAVLASADWLLLPEALSILPQKEAETLAIKYLGSDNIVPAVMGQLVNFKKEWGTEISKAVLIQMAKNPYQYNRAFYSNIIHLLPASVSGELENLTPKEEHLKNMWTNLSEFIKKLLLLKLQTSQAFHE